MGAKLLGNAAAPLRRCSVNGEHKGDAKRSGRTDHRGVNWEREHSAWH